MKYFTKLAISGKAITELSTGVGALTLGGFSTAKQLELARKYEDYSPRVSKIVRDTLAGAVAGATGGSVVAGVKEFKKVKELMLPLINNKKYMSQTNRIAQEILGSFIV